MMPQGPPQVRVQLRIRFQKLGDLRLISHHDLMRCFERMARRANLPLRCTEGFNPKPRMVFALSLPLGVIGRDEVVDVELTEELDAEEVSARLAREAPPGLVMLSAARIEPRETAHVCRMCYRIAIPEERIAALRARIAEAMQTPEWWCERTRPRPRRLDLRSHVRDLRLSGADLEIELNVTPAGTARPEEILAVLGLADLIEGGAIFERTRLDLEETLDPTLAPVERGAGNEEIHSSMNHPDR